MRDLLLAATIAVFAGCAAVPSAGEARSFDPMATAEMAMRSQDLVGALLAYESVPGTDARYLDARAAAVEIERRLVACCEGLRLGIAGRSSTGDRAAVQMLRDAREAWPGMPGIGTLVADAERRAAEPLEIARAAEPACPAVAVEPIEPVRDELWSDMPFARSRVRVAATFVTPPVPVEGPRAPSERLVAVEKKLQDGATDAALADLFDLAKRMPGEPRICSQLTRLLHQRALLAYGQGQLAIAIEDWRRVVALDPANALAQDLLHRACAEQSAAAPPR